METEVVRATQDWETEKTSWGRVKTDGGGEWPDQQRQRDGESKAEDNKEQGAKEIKTSGVGKAVPEESPVCLSSLLSPGCAPLLFSSFHSNKKSSTKSAYPFTSCLSA